MIRPLLIHLHAHLSLNLCDHHLVAATLLALSVCGHRKHHLVAYLCPVSAWRRDKMTDPGIHHWVSSCCLHSGICCSLGRCGGLQSSIPWSATRQPFLWFGLDGPFLMLLSNWVNGFVSIIQLPTALEASAGASATISIVATFLFPASRGWSRIPFWLAGSRLGRCGRSSWWPPCSH